MKTNLHDDIVTVSKLIDILFHFNQDLRVYARGNDADFYFLLPEDIRETKMGDEMVIEIDGFK